MDTFSHLTLSFTTIDLEALLACAAAIAIGAWLARKQVHAFKGKTHTQDQVTSHDAQEFAPVTVAEYGDMRFYTWVRLQCKDQ